MNRLLLALSLGALCATGLGAQTTAQSPQAQAERERYEQGVRDAEAARLRYEEAQRRHQADLARHRREVERAERAQRRYERRRARYDARHGDREAEPAPPAAEPAAAAPAPAAPARAAPAPTYAPAAPVSAASEECERQNRRNRGRGRAIGGLLGGVAGSALGGGSGVGRLATIALSAPVGALIGDSIARLLDCREQQQAAAATEQAVERGGVGSTSTWTSETRPGVTGSSTVTAAAAPTPQSEPCMTVTDIVIVDGEETRAEKRMCRRPPNNRYVRV